MGLGLGFRVQSLGVRVERNTRQGYRGQEGIVACCQ